MRLTEIACVIALALTTVCGPDVALAQEVPPGAPETPFVDPDKAYLFAHMKTGSYGVLYYSVSLDGLHWKALNAGRPVSAEYHGHASIAQGADGRYYLVGNKNDDDPFIRFWVSTDLVEWQPYGTYRPDLSGIPGHPHTLQRIGAPKLFFDRPSGQFLLTWHTPNQDGSAADPERYWASQRTLYALSPDLRTFRDPPRRLFDWDMATIDTIVQPNDDAPGYCAIVKDERYPSYDWPTGKTIRISCGPTLTGPFPPPGPPLSPNFREAPTIVRSPDNREWLLYYEQYAGTSYGLTRGRTLQGPWYQVSGNSGVPEWNRFDMVAGARHGSMIPIARSEYTRLVQAFGIAPPRADAPPPAPAPSKPPEQLANPLLPSGPDPHVTRHGDTYYYMHTRGTGIELWKTRDLGALASAEHRMVWQPQPGTANGRSIWAPELHRLDGKWYIYYTAAHSDHDDDDHRGVFVLENTAADPLQGSWTDLGRVNTAHPGIDGTVFDYGGKRYFVYSPYVGPDSVLAIARMDSPTRLAGKETIIATPDREWERQGGRQILEGPAFLAGPKGELYLSYSGSACWSDGYAIGLLSAPAGSDPLDASAWRKRDDPIIATSPDGGVFAPGHNGFFTSPSGEDWIIYHANPRADMQCTPARAPHVQRVIWNQSGQPEFAPPRAGTALDGPG